jgi:hypothetical protein
MIFRVGSLFTSIPAICITQLQTLFNSCRKTRTFSPASDGRLPHRRIVQARFSAGLNRIFFPLGRPAKRIVKQGCSQNQIVLDMTSI